MIEDGRPPWVPYYPSKLLGALAGMPADQQLVYQIVLLRIYETWGPLKDSIEVIARRCGINKRRASDAIDALFRAGKLAREGGGIINPFASEVMNEAEGFRSKKSTAGISGASRKWGTESRNKAKRHERLAEARKLGRHTELEWSALQRFCGPACLKCREPKPLVKDHIIPIYQGGSDAIENIQPLCARCNQAKGPEAIDYRPPGWKNAIKSVEDACQAPAESLSTPGHLQLQLQEQKKDKKEEPTLALTGGVASVPDGWPPDAWEKFYARYPHKVGKGAARKAFDSVRRHRRTTFDELMRGLERYIAKTDDRPWCNPATWLNQDRWEDKPAQFNGGNHATNRPTGGTGQGRGFAAYALARARSAGDEGPGGGAGQL
jgi:5-methylcytosine-specific restriction endonuclease McrA